jgi:hypothetical protein
MALAILAVRIVILAVRIAILAMRDTGWVTGAAG